MTARGHRDRGDDRDELADIAEVEDPDLDADPTAVTAIEDGVAFTPPDSPTASQSYGTTAEEQRAGESLDRRLSEEQPDVGARRERDLGADEDDELDAEEAALRVVDGPDRLPGATGDPVDHYVEDADAAEAAGDAEDRGRRTDGRG